MAFDAIELFRDGMKIKKSEKANGFSLIELITVLAILLALSLFALPTFDLTVVRSREKLLHERLSNIRSAIDQYVSSRNNTGAYKYPPSIASLTEKIPAGLLKTGYNPGPFLDSGAIGNPLSENSDGFHWDIRDVTGVWHLDVKDPKAQYYVYDIRYPSNGVSGWIKALDGTYYVQW
ncbi:MAG: hypothetical protein Kow0029_11870 [Candidatus Rifleibacteriota bacterium]